MTPLREKAALALAWERLQNRLDRMEGNAEPKAQDPDKLARGKKPKPAPLGASIDPSVDSAHVVMSGGQPGKIRHRIGHVQT